MGGDGCIWFGCLDLYGECGGLGWDWFFLEFGGLDGVFTGV